jgi:hypothetical protein
VAWRSYLKVCVIDGAKGARTTGYCVESPDRDFIPSRLVTVEPPRMKTRMTALPPRRTPTNPPPLGAPSSGPPTIPMSPSTARLMAKPKAGRSER